MDTRLSMVKIASLPAGQALAGGLPGISQKELWDELLDVCRACGGALPRLAHAAEQAVRLIKSPTLQSASPAPGQTPSLAQCPAALALMTGGRPQDRWKVR